jgi:hypothetical protein
MNSFKKLVLFSWSPRKIQIDDSFEPNMVGLIHVSTIVCSAHSPLHCTALHCTVADTGRHSGSAELHCWRSFKAIRKLPAIHHFGRICVDYFVYFRIYTNQNIFALRSSRLISAIQPPGPISSLPGCSFTSYWSARSQWILHMCSQSK